MFQLFVPNLDVKAWNLIVASIQIQYKAQLHYQHEVQVVTLVQKIGTTSFTLLQLASQNSTLAAEGALPKGFDGSAFSYLDAYSAVARYEDLLPSADRDVAKKAFAAVKEAIDALEAHALQKNANS